MTHELPMYIDAEEMIRRLQSTAPAGWNSFIACFLPDAGMWAARCQIKTPPQWRRLRIDWRLCKRLRRQVLPKLLGS